MTCSPSGIRWRARCIIICKHFSDLRSHPNFFPLALLQTPVSLAFERSMVRLAGDQWCFAPNLQLCLWNLAIRKEHQTTFHSEKVNILVAFYSHIISPFTRHIISNLCSHASERGLPKPPWNCFWLHQCKTL